MKYPASIKNLIAQFAELPTVGPKTAERYVFYLLRQSPEKLKMFAHHLSELKNNINICSSCQRIAETDPCEICSDEKRDKALICIVANLQDLISMENTNQFNGQYFVLGGLINAIDGIKPEDLNIRKLAEKINALLKVKNNIEIILALSPTMEGESTAMYLSKLLKNPKIKISRLARGLPMGANLEYVDEMTLGNALKYRNII
jgi:recombination protein RecR